MTIRDIDLSLNAAIKDFPQRVVYKFCTHHSPHILVEYTVVTCEPSSKSHNLHRRSCSPPSEVNESCPTWLIKESIQDLAALD